MYINNEKLIVLESSLRNYFLREKMRYLKNDDNANYKLMKYRGLSLNLDDSNPKNILFVVGIASLEASFDMRTGYKVSGSLAGDEKIVYQWFVFGANQEAMVSIITDKKKKKHKIAANNTTTLDLEKEMKEKRQL